MPLSTPLLDSADPDRGMMRDSSLSTAFAALQKRAAANDKESLDYDADIDRRSYGEKHLHARKHLWGYSGRLFGKWVLTISLGLLMGVVSFALASLIEEIQLLKLGWVEKVLNPCTSAGVCDGLSAEERAAKLQPKRAFAVFAGGNALLVLLGALLTTLFAPEAAGSGIPEVMGYLNGVHVKFIMRLRTLAVKLVGSLLAVTSGLAVGVLGPLVHAGAIVGSGLTRGHKVWRCCATDAVPDRRLCACRSRFLAKFHNDADRRDFISMGAAVGFAAAFGAPVGGVLFALEEAASFFDGKLMWRTLTATTTCCFTIALCERYLAPNLFETHTSCAFNTSEAFGARRRELFEPGLLTFTSIQSFDRPWENIGNVEHAAIKPCHKYV